MTTGTFPVLFAVLGILLVLALRYEFKMPLALTLLLAAPALALGGLIAYLLSVLFSVPVWYVLAAMNVACLVLAAWSELRAPSQSPSV